MDRGKNKGISGLSKNGRFYMKKFMMKIFVLMMGCSIAAAIPFMETKASEESYVNVNDLLGDVKDKLSEAISDMDTETVKEVFGFLEEKVQDGSLKSDEGISSAIREGEDKFGVTINKQDAKKVVETMEKLEDLGFSGEYILEKSEELYDKYGAGFVDHTDEVIAGAVGDAATRAAGNFFSNLWGSVKNFFKNLF